MCYLSSEVTAVAQFCFNDSDITALFGIEFREVGGGSETKS